MQRHVERCDSCRRKLRQLAASGKVQEVLQQREGARRLSPALRQLLRPQKAPPGQLDTGTSQVEETRLPQQDPVRAQAIASEYPEEFALLAPPQQPGEVGRLGHYRVLGVIGSGGMGVVFLAEDPQLERSVALKVMKPALARNAQAKERFLREARAMAAVEHECIVPIYQVGEDGGVPFIAMPLLRGQTLQERLRKGPLPPQEALRVARQVAAALAAAHRRGLIHRDIKPGNIWLEKNGRVRLLDFGLARPQTQDTELTHSGAVIGTPNYMAPEQARGEKLDPRCDLFSLGAVLYHMLSGRQPFGGKTLAMVLAAVMQQEPPPLDSIVKGLPRELVLLVHQLLAKDPQRRPPSAAEVFKQLTRLEKQLQHTQVEVQKPPPVQHEPEHTWPTALVPWERGGPRLVPAWPPQRPGTHSQAPAPARKSGSWGISHIPLWMLGLAAGGAAVLAGLLLGVIFLRSGKGLIRLEINDPQVEVQIKGTQITLRGLQGAKELHVSPGEHALVIRRGDFEFETTRLVVRRGQKVTVRVEYVQGDLVVRQGNRQLARARLPQPTPAKDPPPESRPPKPETGSDSADAKPLPAQAEPKTTSPPPEETKPPSASQSGESSRPVPGAQGPQPPLAVAPFGPKAARAYQEAWAKYLGVPVEKEVDLGGGVKMTFVLIPPGKFEMGAAKAFVEYVQSAIPRPPALDEVPLHVVTVSRPFYLAKTETTVEQFRRFVQATGYQTAAEQNKKARVWGKSPNGQLVLKEQPGAHWQNPGFSQTSQHPVTCVTWDDAQAFCRWLGGQLAAPVRLPTEAEWEHACRAGTNGPYYLDRSPWGRGGFMNSYNYNYSQPSSTPVGKFPPNPFGLYDMLGNVWELCEDTYQKDFYKRSPEVDPVCRDPGPAKTLRGSSWMRWVAASHVYIRISTDRTGYNELGFRVVLPLKGEFSPREEAPKGFAQVEVVQRTGPSTAVSFPGQAIRLFPEHKLRKLTLAPGKVEVLVEAEPRKFPFTLTLQAGQQVRLVVEEDKQQVVIRVDGHEVWNFQEPAPYPVAGIGAHPPVAVAPFGPKAARAYQQAWAQYLDIPLERELDLGGGVKMHFVLIPPGEYEMGTARLHAKQLGKLPVWLKWLKREQPLHRVRITRPFYLGKSEVTVGQFARFVKETGYRTVAKRWGLSKTWRSPGFEQTERHPVVLVHWEDIGAFATWLSHRSQMPVQLPSEAQWEYACRAGSTAPVYALPQGEVPLFKLANTRDQRDGYPNTAPAEALPPNPFGLHHMLGNVFERCVDGYQADFYAKGPLEDPVAPPSPARPLRSGSWRSESIVVRSAWREPWHHNYTLPSGHIGMRLMMPLQSPRYRQGVLAQLPPGCGAVEVQWETKDEELEVVFTARGISLTAEHKLRQVKLASGTCQVQLRRGDKEVAQVELSLRAGERKRLHVRKRGSRFLLHVAQ